MTSAADANAYIARFVAEACEAAGTRPKTAATYRALEDRLVLGEPAQEHDALLLSRGRSFVASNGEDERIS